MYLSRPRINQQAFFKVEISKVQRQILSVRFFQILRSSQNIPTLISQPMRLKAFLVLLIHSKSNLNNRGAHIVCISIQLGMHNSRSKTQQSRASTYVPSDVVIKYLIGLDFEFSHSTTYFIYSTIIKGPFKEIFHIFNNQI